MKNDLLFVKACILGDGCLSYINRVNTQTVMYSMNHCLVQKDWLVWKADELNKRFNRNCKVSEKDVFDKRTNKFYQQVSYTVTSKEFIPLYNLAYPNNKKLITTKLLEDLTLEHLAIFWADDGNLEPKARVGRLNIYKPEDECLIIADWIESLCNAIGRYEDYEGQGFGRLRFPATEMHKLAPAIKPYIHPLFSYKIEMQYKNNTRKSRMLAASSPDFDLPNIDDLPNAKDIKHTEWQAIAKKIGMPDSKNGTKEALRKRIIDWINLIQDDKAPRKQN